MNSVQAPTFQCEFCGKTAEYRPSIGKNGRRVGWQKKQRFCGRDCGYRGRSTRPINPDGHVHSTGYVRVNFLGGVKKLKQRVVMSDHLGRELYRHETVHHKDGNRLNNELDNLELWSKMQPAGQRVADKLAWVIEMAIAYPEFLRAAGYELKTVHVTDEPLPA